MASDCTAAAEDPRGPAPNYTCDFEERPDGTFIWHASLVLFRYLQEPARARAFKGKRILELGSGLGHLGHSLARLGAHITCTDQKKCLPILEASLKELSVLNGTPEEVGGSIRAVELNWGEDSEAVAAGTEAGSDSSYDFIISAELVYLEDPF
ncbi:unnamed protein product, partial [Polarella glacialis]